MTASIPVWPHGYRAAVSVTLDNMGEAAAIERGEWPTGAPVGDHPSVTQSLPSLLNLFDHLNVRLTHFIEGWNASVYPDAIKEVANHGHEVAVHGWRHESWREIDPTREAELITRSTRAFEDLGLEVTGFRPPGGVLTEQSARILWSRRFTYCSPAGTNAAVDDEMVYLPFAWETVDAYYYLPGFAGLREQKGDSGEALAPSELAERLSGRIRECIDSGGYLAILFHPFLESEPERVAAMVEVLRGVISDQRVWCAPCRDVADWVRDHPERFPEDPGLDLAAWAR